MKRKEVDWDLLDEIADNLVQLAHDLRLKVRDRNLDAIYEDELDEQLSGECDQLFYALHENL